MNIVLQVLSNFVSGIFAQFEPVALSDNECLLFQVALEVDCVLLAHYFEYPRNNFTIEWLLRFGYGIVTQVLRRESKQGNADKHHKFQT